MGFVQTPDWTVPVTQEIGGSPGHPPAKVFKGTRGMSLEAIDPISGSLAVAWAQFQPKAPGSYLALQDITGQENSPKPLGVNSLAGADIQGTGAVATIELDSLARLEPGHWYQIVMVGAGEGGSGESIRFSGDQAHQWATQSQTISSAAAPAGAAPSATSSPAALPAAAGAPIAGPLVGAAPGGTSWFNQNTFGVPNWVLALGGAVIAAEML